MSNSRFTPWLPRGILVLLMVVGVSQTLLAQHNPIPAGPFAPLLLLWMILTDTVFRPLGNPLASIAAALVLLAPVLFVLGGLFRKDSTRHWRLGILLFILAAVIWFASVFRPR